MAGGSQGRRSVRGAARRARTPVLLAGTALARRGSRLVLLLRQGSGVFAGESVERRLATLAAALGLDPVVELAP